MHTLPAPRSNAELRAPKTSGIRGDRYAPASGPQSTPFCETYHVKNGGVNQGQHFPIF
jgi:hypothetical protein